MQGARQPLTLAGRVNEDQMAKVDAAAGLAGMPRAHFVVTATLAHSDAEVIYSLFDEPVVVRRPYGAGTVLAAGDTHFFHSHNLETSGNSVKGGYSFYISLVNVDFVRDLLLRYAGP